MDSSSRPKAFTIFNPVYISSTWPLSSPICFHCSAKCFCDRGAMAVVGDPMVAVAMLLKVQTGVEDVQPESYLRQAEEVLSRPVPDGFPDFIHPVGNRPVPGDAQEYLVHHLHLPGELEVVHQLLERTLADNLLDCPAANPPGLDHDDTVNTRTGAALRIFHKIVLDEPGAGDLEGGDLARGGPRIGRPRRESGAARRSGVLPQPPAYLPGGAGGIGGTKVEVVYVNVDDTNGIVLRYIIVKQFREQGGLSAVFALDETFHGYTTGEIMYVSYYLTHHLSVFTQSGP